MVNKSNLFCINFQVYNQLVEKMKSIPGARVENNKFCASVHFRCVDEKVHKLLKPAMLLVAENCDLDFG